MLRPTIKRNHKVRSRLYPICFGLILLLCFNAALAQGLDDYSTEELIREGERSLRRGDCSLAQIIFEDGVLEREPDNIAALMGKARAFICQGAIDLGVAEFRQIITNHPQEVEARIQLSRIYLDQYRSNPELYRGREQDALDLVLSAEQLNSNNPSVHNMKGVIYFHLQDYTAARSSLEYAVNALGSPSSDLSASEAATIHINLGRAYRELNDLELALSSFRRGVALDPINADAHLNVGLVHFLLQNCNDATYELTQAANLSPRSLSAVGQLGIVLFECEQSSEAEERLKQAISIDSVSLPELHTYLARVYLVQGRYEQALQEAQKGAILPPVTADALYWLGQAYEANNDTQAARDAYDKALEIDGNFQEAIEARTALP